MPSLYDQSAVTGLTLLENDSKFAILPFYLVKNEIKKNEIWNVWDQFYGSIPWKPNMAPIMRTSRPEHSPIQQTFFLPALISTEPNKNIYEVNEALQQARLRWHDYDSKIFTFLPSFQDFWTNQVKFKSDDMSRQVQISNNMFIRTIAWQASRVVQFAGQNSISACPFDFEGTSDVKNAAWRAANVDQITSHLTLRVVNRALMTLSEDLDAPPFEGLYNKPADNEGIKGKFVLLCSTEAYGMFPWDDTVKDLKSVNLDLLFQGFHGSLWGRITCKFEKYPIRFGRDGAAVNPQIELDETAETHGVQIVNNPNYIAESTAPYEVAWLMGAEAYKTIQVGAPPKEFVNKDISQKKLYEMNWNGRVFVTDQVLKVIKTGANQVTDVDTNNRGRWLKLIATTTHGCLPCQPFYCLPIIFRRARVPVA